MARSVRTLLHTGLLGLVGTSLGLTQGCVAVGLAVFAVAAGTAAGAGVSHTLDGIAYKTFTVTLEGLQTATLITLKRMDIPVRDTQDTEAGRKILATAADRDVEIELDKLTPRTTRLRVVAKKNWLIRDRATATEIILQTDRTLTDNPNLAALGPDARPSEQRAR